MIMGGTGSLESFLVQANQANRIKPDNGKNILNRKSEFKGGSVIWFFSLLRFHEIPLFKNSNQPLPRLCQHQRGRFVPLFLSYEYMNVIMIDVPKTLGEDS
jgi:hypothetical protein